MKQYTFFTLLSLTLVLISSVSFAKPRSLTDDLEKLEEEKYLKEHDHEESQREMEYSSAKKNEKTRQERQGKSKKLKSK